MAQNLRWFLSSIGLPSWDYHNVAEIEATFINGEREEIEGNFIPYENLLKKDSHRDLTAFLNSVENKLQKGEKVECDCIQVSTYAITINPFTPQLQLFMRDV